MAKIVRRTKRKLRFEAFAFILLALAIVTTLFSNLFIGSMQNSLTMQIQNMNYESETIKIENQKLSIEIQTLQNKDRVYTIAQDAGLEQNQDNIVSISNGE